MVPLLLTFHCWLVAPVQSQVSTLAPAAVLEPATSRHRLPYTTRVLAGVSNHDWLAAPLQAQICSWVPHVVEAPGTSKQRFDATPRMMALEPSPRPHAQRSRLTPEALLSRSVRLVPLPPRVSMLYESPVRRPGQ